MDVLHPVSEGITGNVRQTSPVAAQLAGHVPSGDEHWGWLAERVGFEPTMSFWPILTFQASAFDHSATAPHKPDRFVRNTKRQSGDLNFTWIERAH